MSIKGKILATNISERKGIVKHEVNGVEFIEDFGIKGDAHAEKGIIRQISLLGIESVNKMKAIGVEGLCNGKFAENLTTEGIVLYEIPVGTKLKIGESVCEVTQIGKKCHASEGCEIMRLVGTCVMPKEGIFVKVLEGGMVKPNDTIEVIE